MKLVVFAHTPPPHHGQSFMVQLMLEGFGGDARQRTGGAASPQGIDCYHVNARFSETLEDVGEFRGGKVMLIFWYCLQALWLRFRYGARHLYYVPAPGKRVALFRDWLVMLFCRRFFDSVILHWHAAGMAKWLETASSSGVRSLTYRLYRPVTLSIVLSRYNVADAEKLLSHRVLVVNNGIPDPCPDFTHDLRVRRLEAYAHRRKIFAGGKEAGVLTVNVLFLAHCSREKGVFAAILGVLAANQKLNARGLPMRLRLTIAGNFITDAEKAEYDRLREDPVAAATVTYAGFVSGQRKSELLREADLFLFPTHYLGENQPVNLIEAMAFGVPLVTTRWRSLPEMLPAGHTGLVSGQDPDEIAEAVLRVLGEQSGEDMREHFRAHFTLERHLADLANAIRTAAEAGA
jgi:glycosyltransferase involved in cell wall biosynthesis